jgi:hypothetical protein
VNIKCENIVANPPGNPYGLNAEMGAGMFAMQYCRNIHLSNSYLYCSNNAIPTNLFAGRMMNFANCIDVVDYNHFSKDCWGIVGFFEDFCDYVRIINPVDVVNSSTVYQGGAYAAYLLQSGYNTFVFENPTLLTNLSPTGTPNFQFYIQPNDVSIQIKGTFTWHGPWAQFVCLWPRWMNCILDYNDGTNYATLDFAHTLRYSIKVPLSPNMNDVGFRVPSGIIDCDLYTSSNVNPTTISSWFIGLQNISVMADAGPGFVLNGAAQFSVLGSGYGGGHVSDWVQGTNDGMRITTTGAAQVEGNFVGISCRVPRVLLANYGNLGLGQVYIITDEQMSAELCGTPTQLTWQTMLVAALPAASAANTGFRYLVGDATTTTFGTVVAGAGSNKVPVYSDGTNWRIG